MASAAELRSVRKQLFLSRKQWQFNKIKIPFRWSRVTNLSNPKRLKLQVIIPKKKKISFRFKDTVMLIQIYDTEIV